jgi:4-hydroxy-tetrahydrodipicolinate reductase
MSKIKVTILGASGKMGQMLIQETINDDELILVGAHDITGSHAIGKDAGYFIGKETEVFIQDNIDHLLSECDVIIDFTRPEGTMEFLKKASDNKTSYVIGTTGFNPSELDLIQQYSQQIPICMAPNMSVGVNVLISLVEKAAELLPEYDFEVVEAHHKHKVDAPSGTALRLGQAAADGLNISLEKNAIYTRYGREEKRRNNEIGFSTIRAGDIVGEHTVLIAGNGERIELTHKATSRLNFASGALKAAKFVANQKPKLFDMQEVLNLK